MKRRLRDYFKVDKELVIVFLLVAVAGIIFYFVSNQRAFLNFFYLPVLIGAYFFGKRYATQSALLSIILVFVIAYYYPQTFTFEMNTDFYRWLDILTWGGFLMVTGYFMGHLYEKKESANREIKQTYQGIIEMLSLVIDSVDKETQSHSYRVSVISEMIAKEMGLSDHSVENIRAAALLHDLGKLGVSNEILNKIGSLNASEREHMKIHTTYGAGMMQPVGGKILEILPFVLYHHEKYDGSGYHKMVGADIPLGARIIAVADVYDSLISDRPYRKGLSPFVAKQEITDHSGTHFDPKVVDVFVSISEKVDSEIPLLPRGRVSR